MSLFTFKIPLLVYSSDLNHFYEPFLQIFIAWSVLNNFQVTFQLKMIDLTKMLCFLWAESFYGILEQASE